MSWITSIYWLLDIPSSFLVGYAVLEAPSYVSYVVDLAGDSVFHIAMTQKKGPQ